MKFNEEPQFNLRECVICPRTCRVDRSAGKLGYCQTDAGSNIHAVVLHQGEEPVISGRYGISNVFFGHCNLQCIYCQNHQISNNTKPLSSPIPLLRAVDTIAGHLNQGSSSVGFVSPMHVIPQMLGMMDALEARGLRPYYVYNSNGYDRVDVLERLASRVHVYLPDLKYLDRELARRYSGAIDYPDVARCALREMFRQKGDQLLLDDAGMATQGMVIRHLVLPGHIENTLACLRFIARELSPNIHISLMSQYHPPKDRKLPGPINRTLKPEEYDQVVEEMLKLGLETGWVQELDSAGYYLPDFDSETPFG